MSTKGQIVPLVLALLAPQAMAAPSRRVCLRSGPKAASSCRRGGGSQISDEDVHGVAAYIWVISRPGGGR